MEFFSTVNLWRKDSVNDPKNFTFCLEGQRRELILVELAWHLDLYNRSVATSPEFVVFLEHCHKRFLEGFTESGYCTEIANGSYIRATSNKGKIRKVVHRFIHRLITFSINQKKRGPSSSVGHVFSVVYHYTKYLLSPPILCGRLLE